MGVAKMVVVKVDVQGWADRGRNKAHGAHRERQEGRLDQAVLDKSLYDSIQAMPKEERNLIAKLHSITL